MGLFSRRAARPAPPGGSTGLPIHFAVLDIETTGLDRGSDRIVEIAVVIIDATGLVLHEWTTLVDPGGSRDAGPVGIHGIQSSWLAAAPTFGEIAGDLVDRLVGRVLVAHNVRFDTEFIESEFRRLGTMPRTDYTALDTMAVADQMGLPRGLAALASALDVTSASHSALDDARVTGHVLALMLRFIDPSTFHETDVRLPEGYLPRHPMTGKVMHRQAASAVTTPRSILDGVTLPIVDVTEAQSPEGAAAYLTLLETVLADGYVSVEERDLLLRIARDWGLATGDVARLHRDYLDGVLNVVFEDHRMTFDERNQVTTIATWLGITTDDIDLVVRQARARGRARTKEQQQEVKGLTVAFTGRGVYTRSLREALCAKYEISFRSTISDGCAFLVIGSPATANKTVEKAQSLGIPIVLENQFWATLGERT